MRGFVSTPATIVEEMLDRLFATALPHRDSTVLDPGCGDGAFIIGLIEWCKSRGLAIPRITGVESHPGRAASALAKFRAYPSVVIENRDFLKERRRAQFDYVIGNPPYVSILRILERERTAYRAKYESARGRFDLYMLFFEEAIEQLKSGGRLVFITPEKYLYVKTCDALRMLLMRHRLVEIALADETAFKGFVTYPTVTVIEKGNPTSRTTFTDRDGASLDVSLPADGSSFLPVLGGHEVVRSGRTLEDICLRVSCGIATGADSVYVRNFVNLPDTLEGFAHPTISGRQLTGNGPLRTNEVMLIPYDAAGKLIPETHLGALADDLSLYKDHLLNRLCAKKKPWYAFHDSVPFDQMLRPKILCKDITKTPDFWADREGYLVPRHSVYYIVPKEPERLDVLLEYLRGPQAQAWLQANCQRAANGFLRVQSSVLRKLPIPESISGTRHKKANREEVAA